MANKRTYTVSRAIPKEDLFYMDENVYIPMLEKDMKRDLGDAIVTMLESGEKIVRITKVVREDDFPYNQYLYTQRLVCEDLVRCKDCVHKEREQPGMVYCPMMVGSWVAEDHFCKWGERGEDDPSHPFADDVMMGGEDDRIE